MEINTTNIITGISKDQSEPEWLRSFREKKFAYAATLPASATYGLGITGLSIERDVLFEQSPEYSVDASKSVELYTWKEAVAQEEIVPYLERLMQSELYPNGETQGDARASAFFRSGIVIYAQPSVDDKGELKEEKCVLTTTLTSGIAADVLIVILKEGAKFSLENIYAGEDGVLARTLVIVSERDTYVTVLQKNTELKSGTLFLANKALVAPHSKVTWKELFVGSSLVKSHTNSVLIGEGSCADVFQGFIPEENARHDIFASVKHAASHTHSRIRAAGVSFDNTKTVYRGLIDMKNGVESVVGAQEGKFLAVSPSAEIDAIPALDIASNSVACSHKLVIDHVRENDVFYPKLRGLGEEESMKFFIEGHLAFAFAEKENEEIMEGIRRILFLRKSL